MQSKPVKLPNRNTLITKKTDQFSQNLLLLGSQKCLEFPNETIQGAIESALISLNPTNVPLTSFASRTDKGVHALMNTFHVDLEHKKPGECYQPHIMKKMLNAYLKENKHEILVTNASVVPQSFHARHYVKWRSYHYRLAILKPELRVKYSDVKFCEDYLPISQLNRCHVVQSDLDIDVVKDVTKLYCGSHDFSTFTKYMLRNPWKSTKRVIDEIKFYEVPFLNSMHDPLYSNITMWEFYIKSTSFLYHQIRKMVGSALSAGFGNLSIADVQTMLKDPNPDKWVKCHLAPSCGLYLSNLHYDKDGFISRDMSVLNDEKTDLET